MTITTPIPDAQGNAIAAIPQINITIPQSIIQPVPVSVDGVSPFMSRLCAFGYSTSSLEFPLASRYVSTHFALPFLRLLNPGYRLRNRHTETAPSESG